MKYSSRWFLFLALVLAAINLRPAITSFAPLIERIASDLSLSRGFVSLVTALPVLLMGLLAPLAPRLAVRLGLERAIAFCMATLFTALGLRLFSHQEWILIGTAGVVGIAVAVAGPLLSGYIKRYFFDQMGKIGAWYALSMAVGGTLGAVVTAPVTDHLAGDWSLGLSVWALPTLVACAVWLCLPNQPESVRKAAGLPWRSRRAWLISLFFTLQAGLFYALVTWLVARYHEAGFSVGEGNTFFSAFMLIGLPSSFAIPWLVQRFGNRHIWMATCGLVAACGLALIAWLPNWSPLLVCMVLGIALNGSFSLSLVLPMYEAATPMDVSRLTAMMLCTGYGLACLSPVLVGIGRDIGGSYLVPFAVLALLAICMSLLALCLRPNPVLIETK
ncbi:MFS transporter [Pseudomonas sp. ABC1]|nr:MFS transporter [Pseudomonas sp. ABC1]QLF94990.1 MFS transporter [Pseudomonas sp. ABC1]